MLPGVVYGLGPDVVSSGHLYAELTGRPYRSCNSLAELKASCNDVVLCTISQLTPHLMHALYAREGTLGAPGLMFAQSPSDLDDVCRYQASKLKAAFPATSQRVFIYPMLEFKTMTRGEDLFVGGSLPAEELLPILSSGVPLLTLLSHSDGIDLRLSLQQHTCAFADSVPSGNEDLMPGCQVLDQCIRFLKKPTVLDARNKGSIVPIKLLRAQIGLISACQGVRFSDGIVDPVYGLTSALLRQAGFAAVITTWRRQTTPFDHRHLNALINDLCSGVQIGAAVHSYNQSTIAKYLGSNLCVLGDPTFTLNRDLNFTSLPVSGVQPPDRKQDPASVRRTAEFLQELVAHALRESPEFDSAKGNILVRRLAANRELEGQADHPTSLDALLLDFMSAGPWLDEYLCRFGQIDSMTEGVFCPSCSAPAVQIQTSFPNFQMVPRKWMRCACCEESRNMPLNWETCLDLSDGQEGLIRICHVPEGAHVMLGLYYPWGPAMKVFNWPSVGNEWLPFRLSDELPSLPLKCRILVVRQLEIGVLGFGVRRLLHGFSIAGTPQLSHQGDVRA